MKNLFVMKDNNWLKAIFLKFNCYFVVTNAVTSDEGLETGLGLETDF